MSQEDDDFWNTSNVRAFNFDDEETAAAPSSGPTTKTLSSVLAATSLNEPFLKPSMILCKGRDKVPFLVEHLLSNSPEVKTRSAQDPKSFIIDIVEKKKPINFSTYKSLSDKLALLDCAICCCDGDTITAVTIFLAKTLKRSLFVEVLRKRPLAINQYLNYLKISDSQELSELSQELRNSR